MVNSAVGTACASACSWSPMLMWWASPIDCGILWEGRLFMALLWTLISLLRTHAHTHWRTNSSRPRGVYSEVSAGSEWGSNPGPPPWPLPSIVATSISSTSMRAHMCVCVCVHSPILGAIYNFATLGIVLMSWDCPHQKKMNWLLSLSQWQGQKQHDIILSEICFGKRLGGMVDKAYDFDSGNHCSQSVSYWQVNVNFFQPWRWTFHNFNHFVSDA